MPLIFKTEGFEALNDQLLTLAKDVRSESEANGFIKILTMSTTKTLNRLIPEVQARAPYDGETNKSGIHLRDTVKVRSKVPNAKDRESHFVEESDAVIGILSVKKSAVSLAQEFGHVVKLCLQFVRVNLCDSLLQSVHFSSQWDANLKFVASNAESLCSDLRDCAFILLAKGRGEFAHFESYRVVLIILWKMASFKSNAYCTAWSGVILSA